MALRPRTGQVFWSRRLPAEAAGSLHVTRDLVLVGLVDGRIVAFARPRED